MLSKEWLQGCKMMADAGVMFQSDAVKSLLDHITELEENATAQALALKAAKAMQQAETERADANERDAKRYRWFRSANPHKIEDPELRDSIGSLPAGPGDVDDAIDQAMSNM